MIDGRHKGLPWLVKANGGRRTTGATGVCDAKAGDSVLEQYLARKDGFKQPSVDQNGRCKGVRKAVSEDAKSLVMHEKQLSEGGFEKQAAMGFEPMNNGFAIRPLGPLGYAADRPDMTTEANPPMSDTQVSDLNGRLGRCQPDPGPLNVRPAR